MSTSDKFEAKAEGLGGKAKEAVGRLGGDERLRAEGEADQAKATVKDAVENAKDAVGDAVGKIRGAFGKE
ncbi:CsbD family protein [Amycolatopsis thermoflava]|uniref:CsbD family protein n=1 Tax=Amycolatopsis thermoflava TaxID=84480 RepID=UPI00041A8DD2|nr:CsbD family protein [Amycolatopsis thermoflava]